MTNYFGPTPSYVKTAALDIWTWMMSARCQDVFRAKQTTTADIETSLNTLLLVTALTLSFSIPLLLGASHDALVAADTRIIKGGAREFYLEFTDKDEDSCKPQRMRTRSWGSTLSWQECGL